MSFRNVDVDETLDSQEYEPEYCGECGVGLWYFTGSKDGLCPACQKVE